MMNARKKLLRPNTSAVTDHDQARGLKPNKATVTRLLAKQPVSLQITNGKGQ